ncbi:condensin-2 complex subunit D3 [Vigna radiata var. radiata]|uniref:Condensin-2 complex subunit D3 n=1 Tax=Vigna radiata var. radiata TaxID=3916 RepID=A0A1S3TZ60_VIGRR|nr:condensin-2 complex subunit D3 [Vigna radiata var. radiata]
MEMEETVARVISEIEEFRGSHEQPPLSEQTLRDLQILLNNSLSESLYDELPSKNLSPSALIAPIASAMDSSPSHHSLLASDVFLSLLLAPNAPVFTLFTPISFLSFLRSLRRSCKAHSNPGPAQETSQNRKRKRAGRIRAKNPQNDNDSTDTSSQHDPKLLLRVLEKLVRVMDFIHLDRFPETLRSLVQTIAEIPVTALDACGNAAQYSKLLNLCSRVLREVLKPEHGESSNSAAEVLKSLCPLVLMAKSQARSFALEFVTSLGDRCDGVKKALVNFPRYLVKKAPERAEPRALAVDSIIEVVRAVKVEDQIAFVKYVVQMTQGKANLRLLAVDLILNLMTSLKDPLGVESEGSEAWGMWCLEALMKRCSDVSGGIRARALSSLAQLVGLLSRGERTSVVLKEFLGFGNVGGENAEGTMNDMLRRRCMDDKAAVRKAALLLVTNLTSLLGGAIDEVVLKTMGMACSDPLISMRKAAIAALSQAFRTFSSEAVITEWLHSVPRLITDNESSIQDECENAFQELVLDRISKAASASSSYTVSSHRKMKGKFIDNEMEMLFPDGILYLLREVCNGEVSPWVKKICTNLGKKKRMNKKIVIALQNIIRESESIWLSHSMPIEKWTAPPGAWFLLSEVSTFLSKAVDWGFLHHHWQLLDKHEVEVEFKSPIAQKESSEEESTECNTVAWASDRVFLLQTISNVSVELPPEPAADLAHNLLKRVQAFNMHSTEVDAHLKALKTLCKRKASNLEEAESLILKWIDQVLARSSGIIEKFISDNSEKNAEGSFFTPPRSGTRKGRKSVAISKALSKAVTAIYTVGSLAIVCPSADMSNVVPLLHTIITSGSSGPKLNNLPGPSTSLQHEAPSFYIQGWLAMGKLCLADGKLAKNYIPLFVQELEKSESAALRNNIVVMMADFCVRYTALVDCYITKITRCLLDPCELVRRQTFILLSRLLQRDYVKWRGVLFLRFLLSLVDESEKIRQLADFLFGNILKVKSPLLAYNSFVEAVFVLNDCHAHNGHRESHGSRKESQSFSIRGTDEEPRSKRMHIYVSLLKQMAPEHLLATFAKLCAEILAAASDGMLNIEDATAQSVLEDAFRILGCKEIRIPSTRASSESADIEEEGDNGSAARGKAVTQAVKKSLIQNTVPIFIELKRLLETKNSPLIGSLMECLRIILKDYKNEIDDILVADKQLQKELIYDIQKYEAAKAKATVAESVVGTKPKSGSNQSPGVSKSLTKTQGKAVGQSMSSDKLPSDSRVASAMADAAAAATARSVLREINKGTGTPPLRSCSVPKVKSPTGMFNFKDVNRRDAIESVKKKQSFDSDEEN